MYGADSRGRKRGKGAKKERRKKKNKKERVEEKVVKGAGKNENSRIGTEEREKKSVKSLDILIFGYDCLFLSLSPSPVSFLFSYY